MEGRKPEIHLTQLSALRKHWSQAKVFPSSKTVLHIAVKILGLEPTLRARYFKYTGKMFLCFEKLKLKTVINTPPSLRTSILPSSPKCRKQRRKKPYLEARRWRCKCARLLDSFLPFIFYSSAAPTPHRPLGGAAAFLIFLPRHKPHLFPFSWGICSRSSTAEIFKLHFAKGPRETEWRLG